VRSLRSVRRGRDYHSGRDFGHSSAGDDGSHRARGLRSYDLGPAGRCRELRDRTGAPEIDGWEQKLEESGDHQLAPIAENLWQRRALLTADGLDGGTIGMLMGVLGEQVAGMASSRLRERIGGKLRQMSGLLATEWRAVSDRN
jgi:hypothetical protein